MSVLVSDAEVRDDEDQRREVIGELLAEITKLRYEVALRDWSIALLADDFPVIGAFALRAQDAERRAQEAERRLDAANELLARVTRALNNRKAP